MSAMTDKQHDLRTIRRGRTFEETLIHTVVEGVTALRQFGKTLLNLASEMLAAGKYERRMLESLLHDARVKIDQRMIMCVKYEPECRVLSS